MQLFIRELAPHFEALFGKSAKVTRINAVVAKGGAFPDFVLRGCAAVGNPSALSRGHRSGASNHLKLLVLF
jgi:hypothetical protein